MTRNPFIIQGTIDAEHFCDREKESAALYADICNGRHVTLLAPRRFGKTQLISHVCELHADELTVLTVDLLSTQTLADFVKAFADAAIGALDSPAERSLSVFATFLKSIRPSFSTDGQGGMSLSFGVEATQAETSLREVFAYLSSKRNREIVIAFDEFQQVSKYPEAGTEALLRNFVQKMPQNIHFIFSGSEQHLLGEMFISAKRPFYQSTTLFELSTIDRSAYCDFARKFYRAERRRFDETVFQALYDRFDGVTWYVQAVMNELWSLTPDLTSWEQVREAIANLVARRRLLFHDLMVSQSESVRSLLTAIAKEGRVKAPMAQAFIGRHHLPAPSTLAGALTQALSKELIYKSNTGYIVYDYLLAEYLRMVAH